MNDKHELRGSSLGVRDGIAGLVILTLFVVMLAATWDRWTHPIIDHGREMNIPARLLAGDRLYIDIYYYYGPVAPYFNAALYYLFGVRLAVLHASGMVCAVVILAMIYWLSRQLLGVIEAALTTSLVLIMCALPSYFGNFVQPYAYAALYGWMFALVSLVCLVRYVVGQYRGSLWWAGFFIGITMACKPEVGAIGLAPAAMLLIDVWRRNGRLPCRPFWQLVIPAATIAVLTYVPIVVLAPTQVFLETYRSFSQPQMMHFARWMNGALDWPYTGWALLASLGMLALTCGLTALCGIVFDRQISSLWRRHLWWIAALIVIGWYSWTLPPRGPEHIDVNPFRSAPIVLAGTIVFLASRLLRHGPDSLSAQHRVFLLLAIFSLLSIGRVLFNVSLRTPYTIFTVPAAIVVYVYLLQRLWPSLLPSHEMRLYAARAGIAILTAFVPIMAMHHALGSRARNTSQIRAARGILMTRPDLARPLNEAIRFVDSYTRPGEPIVTLPEGTLINFFGERANPLPDEIIVPGYLTPGREQEMIRRIEARHVRVIVLLNRLTIEYRDRGFGVDYNQTLMHWIDEHYRPVVTFGETEADDHKDLTFGGDTFFIRAYERKTD